MKRLFAFLFAISLIIGAVSPTYAEDSGDGSAEGQTAPESSEAPSENQAQEKTPVKVSSNQELKTAISNAVDGDIIEISKQISIAGSMINETDKNITLRRAEDFYSYAYFYDAMFEVWAGGTLKGFKIVDTAEYKQTIDLSESSKVIDCHFDGKNVHREEFINVKSKKADGDKATISGCTFTNNESYSVHLGYNTAAICESCTFINNNLAGIYNCGNLELSDCTITGNWSGGIIGYSCTTQIADCRIYDNILFDPKHDIGTDININGTLIITDQAEDEGNFYDEFTGERIDLPYNNDGAIRLIYLPTEKDAEEYFAFKFAPDEPDPEEQEPQEPDDGQEPPSKEEDESQEKQPPIEDEEDQKPPTNDNNGSQEPPKDQENTDTELPQEPSTRPSEDSDNKDSDTFGSSPGSGTSSGGSSGGGSSSRRGASSGTASVNVASTQDTSVSASDSSFSDIISSAYYYDAVQWAIKNGITSGYDDGTFRPDAVCTRAQIMTFLWRAAGSPESNATDNPFIDVSSDAYHYKAVLWAVEKGITSGTTTTTFSPDEGCTRAQAVTFLYRANNSPAVSGSNSFSDVAFDAYYHNAVSWAVANNITNGTTFETFSPGNTCTRAQIVTFLWRDMAGEADF